jgi:hypothetical protein
MLGRDENMTNDSGAGPAPASEGHFARLDSVSADPPQEEIEK